MTNLKAELVLKDCNYLISKYDQKLQGVELRLSWWNIISLLRAVGHVLEKVDSKISAKHAKIIKQEFEILKSTKPEPHIFWSFIDAERNNFLKQYDHNVRRQVSAVSIQPGQSVGLKLSFGLEGVDGGSIGYGDDMLFESFLKEGHFRNKNELEVITIAANWWHSYIENIKKRVIES